MKLDLVPMLKEFLGDEYNKMIDKSKPYLEFDPYYCWINVYLETRSHTIRHFSDLVSREFNNRRKKYLISFDNIIYFAAILAVVKDYILLMFNRNLANAIVEFLLDATEELDSELNDTPLFIYRFPNFGDHLMIASEEIFAIVPDKIQKIETVGPYTLLISDSKSSNGIVGAFISSEKIEYGYLYETPNEKTKNSIKVKGKEYYMEVIK